MIEQRYETEFTLYPYVKRQAQSVEVIEHRPVVIVGAGPVGMALALDLARKGTDVLVLDDHEGVGKGSRAICFSKRTLDICDRLGCGQSMVDKGVVWNVGRVFHGESEVYTFNLTPEGEQRNPAFINLQQPYFEKFLVDQVRVEQSKGAPVEIRGANRVTGVEQHVDHAILSIDTPDGPYRIQAEWVVACDGASSPLRSAMRLEFDGRIFEDNFLIADVKMTAPFPTERWFWFEPPFKDAGQSALLHKQPDDIWRIDFQLGWDIDRKAELDPDKIRARVDAMLGDKVDYELEWCSIYTFQCRRMEKFRHGSILFAGDSAHQVSPFGARGANSGIQDADNLAWKLDMIVKGLAPESLLDSYSTERVYAADENILNSTRATDFLTPKTDMSRLFRNAVLELAQHHSFARPLVNSGRLSVPCVYDDHCLNGPDLLDGPSATRVGAACVDVPLGQSHLLTRLGNQFCILGINTCVPDSLTIQNIRLSGLSVRSSDDGSGLLAERYLGQSNSAVYLIRPDQHIAARWPSFDESQIEQALLRAIGKA